MKYILTIILTLQVTTDESPEFPLPDGELPKKDNTMPVRSLDDSDENTFSKVKVDKVKFSKRKVVHNLLVRILMLMK